MEFKVTTPAAADEDLIDPPTLGRPIQAFAFRRGRSCRGADTESSDLEASHLPRSYGTETLSLLARDPHTVFAFWDIDWNAAFRGLAAKERKVHLRLLDSKGTEQTAVEVEPMAGSCYVTVADADAAYSGEIGYYHPATNLIASRHLPWSQLPRTHTRRTKEHFATVPFHLGFQRMVDLLQVTKQENATLTAMLADLCERVTSAESANDDDTGTTRARSRGGKGAVDCGHFCGGAFLESSPSATAGENPGFRIPRAPAGGFGGSSRGA